MPPGNIVAIVVSGLSVAGIAAAARAVALVPKLQLAGWAGTLCYVAAAATILCFGLLLAGMQRDFLAALCLCAFSQKKVRHAVRVKGTGCVGSGPALCTGPVTSRTSRSSTS
jgi:hypothetical protein